MAARQIKSSADFLLLVRTFSHWITDIVFISVNRGALDVTGQRSSPLAGMKEIAVEVELSI